MVVVAMLAALLPDPLTTLTALLVLMPVAALAIGLSTLVLGRTGTVIASAAMLIIAASVVISAWHQWRP